APIALHVDLEPLEILSPYGDATERVRVITVGYEGGKVLWTQAFVVHLSEDSDVAVALKVPFVGWIHNVVQEIAFVVPQRQFKQPRSMSREMLAFRTENIIHKVAEAAVVGAVDEPNIGVEPRRDVAIHGVETELARVARGKDVEGRPGQVRAVTEFGFTGHSLGFHKPVLIELNVGIHSAHTVESDEAFRCGAKSVGISLQLAVGVNDAGAGALAEFAVHAQHAEISVVAGERVSRDHTLARRAVVG